MLGISDDILSDALSDIRIDGRMEVAYADDNFSVIIDYAHNAISTEMLLDTLRAYNPQRLVVVFGTGGNRPKGRRISMGKACGEKADFSIITSDNPRYENPEEIIADILGSISKTNGKYIAIEDRSSAIKYAIENAQKGDMIAIIGKGHENYQEICGIRYHMKDREIVDEVICELKHKIG